MFKKIKSETSGGTNRQKRLTEEDLIREHLSAKGYSLPGNNCEHFATYCATGKKRSKQVRRAMGSIFTITLVATGSFILRAITRKKEG